MFFFVGGGGWGGNGQRIREYILLQDQKPEGPERRIDLDFGLQRFSWGGSLPGATPVLDRLSLYFIFSNSLSLSLSQVASSIPSCSAACKMYFRTYIIVFFFQQIILQKYNKNTKREREGGGGGGNWVINGEDFTR